MGSNTSSSPLAAEGTGEVVPVASTWRFHCLSSTRTTNLSPHEESQKMDGRKFALTLMLASAPYSVQAQSGIPATVQTRTLEQRIGRADPSKYNHLKAVHEGAGSMYFRAMLGTDALDTNLIFFHRGVIQPKSGIGEHFHNKCEEMFVILDGEAQFTVDGMTSVLKAPAGVPDRIGHAHGIYNATDKPVQWLNINVGLSKTYDTFNLGDSRVGVPLDPIPQFVR